MIDNVAQFKLINGEEVICEVVEWNEDEMIIRRAMCLGVSHDETYGSMYVLRPWMTMIEGSDEYIVMSTSSVVATCRPNPSYLEEYYEGVQSMNVISKKRNKLYKEREKELKERLKKQLSEFMSDSASSDLSHPSNVISFPTKDDIIH